MISQSLKRTKRASEIWRKVSMQWALAVLVFAYIANAIVDPNSLHYSDASDVAVGIASAGFSSGDYYVGIYRNDGDTNYVINWIDEYYNADSDSDDIVRLLSSISAAGVVSENTSWRSYLIIVGFSNQVMLCTTESARDLLNMRNLTMEQVMTWALVNMVVQER